MQPSLYATLACVKCCQAVRHTHGRVITSNNKVIDNELVFVVFSPTPRFMQVRLKEAEKFMSAAEIAASHSAAAAPERAYHNQLLDPRNRYDP